MKLVIPGIILAGTMPTLYRIPVTSNLVRYVRHRIYLSEPTIVSVQVPDLSRPCLRHNEGMKPLDNRQALLRYCEAFKRSAGIRQTV